MTPDERREIEVHLSAVADILDRNSAVRGGAWPFHRRRLADGREVNRRFVIEGYVRSTPRETQSHE